MGLKMALNTHTRRASDIDRNGNITLQLLFYCCDKNTMTISIYKGKRLTWGLWFQRGRVHDGGAKV